MNDHDTEMLTEIKKISSLLELLAEDKIAQRDARQRSTLRQIAGGNKAKQRAILMLNGTNVRKTIIAGAGIDRSDLGKLITKIAEAKLLLGGKKAEKPQLEISIPSNFFKNDAKTE